MVDDRAASRFPFDASDNRFSEIAGRVIYRQSGTPPGRSNFFFWVGLQAVPACSENPACLLPGRVG